MHFSHRTILVLFCVPFCLLGGVAAQAGQYLPLTDSVPISGPPPVVRPAVVKDEPPVVEDEAVSDMPPTPVGPTVEVSLSKPIYHIHIDPKTGEPKMPNNAVAAARALRWPAGVKPPTVFTWRVYLDWDYPRFPTHHPIQNRTFNQSSPFKIDFGDTVRGGVLTVAARAMLGGQPVFGKARAVVLGENPDRALLLRAFPRSRFGLIASKIAMFESGMKQFEPACGDLTAGLPVMSYSEDIGIMQLNVPTGSVVSEDQIWDWRANVKQGLEILADKRHTTQLASRAAVERRMPAPGMERLGYLNLFRRLLSLPPLPAPSTPPLSDVLGSGILPEDKDEDHLRLSQAERDAIRRYNGGCEYSFQLVFDPSAPVLLTAGWIIDPSRGGIRPNCGDPDYVRHVLIARSGFKLEPPKPKKTGQREKGKSASHKSKGKAPEKRSARKRKKR